jgi:hypothetical protein
MKKLLVAALGVMLASPAFAAIQNVKVSGDITTTWLDRSDFDLGTTLGSENNVSNPTSWQSVGLKRQNVFITQTRVRIDADLSDNVSTTVGLINERAWTGENGTVNTNNQDTNVQLYLASVTMRELLYSPLTVTVGRQVFAYGNGLILGDGGPNNAATGALGGVAADLTMRTSYDGVKAILDYKPLTVDFIYFKNQQNILNGNINERQSSSDVLGMNANYQLNDAFNSLVEGYLFARVDGHSNFAAQGSPNITTDKADTLYVPGLRASTNPIKGLNVQGEVAWQLGTHPATISTGNGNTALVNEKRGAMAIQGMASYSLPVLEKYKPQVSATYTYASGDKTSANGVSTYRSNYTAWDPFNEAQGSGTIYNTLYNLSNMHILALTAQANPLEDVTAAFTWSGLWAADKLTASNPLVFIQPDGSTATPATKTNKYGLGNEYDVNLTYNYTEDVTFGVSLGWYVPGDVFTKNNNNTASQALADVAVKF